MKTFVERILQMLASDIGLTSRIREFSLNPEERHASHGPLLLVLPVGTRLVRKDESRKLVELEAIVELRFHRFQGGDNPTLLLAELESDIAELLEGTRLADGGNDYLDEAPLTVQSSKYDFPAQDGKTTDPPYLLEMRLSGGRFISV